RDLRVEVLEMSKLFRELYITVNSSTYAETFYTSLGFKKVGEKEINKGIVSIPMKRNI
ncbi:MULTISPECIES: GNAT family N-acetyltransferase, partial [Bacteroides]|uniref:GNAT family N-acetyltransferase n=1 Tax=Bacteroides TaxID=816 RepID=UPI00248BCD11